MKEKIVKSVKKTLSANEIDQNVIEITQGTIVNVYHYGSGDYKVWITSEKDGEGTQYYESFQNVVRNGGDDVEIPAPAYVHVQDLSGSSNTVRVSVTIVRS